jgi:tRNA threonylcarbamoyl adenosine modification protein (Sua5/YciO/YrdC/YwlC family)
MRIELRSQGVNHKIVDQAVDILRDGGIIIYPTDTVYGIGCDITNKAAIERIYRAKDMDKQKPLSFICADLKDISNYAKVDTSMYRILRKYLPGAYTFILPATRQVPKLLVSKQRTVGIRIPEHDFTLAMVEGLGRPIVSTSVNIDERSFASDPKEFHAHYEGKVDLVLDAGPAYGRLSSVIDLTTHEPVVIREGQGDLSWLY